MHTPMPNHSRRLSTGAAGARLARLAREFSALGGLSFLGGAHGERILAQN